MIAIDPGVAGEGNAVALFYRDELVTVAFQRTPAFGEQANVIVERPEYQGMRSLRARPIDLMNLSWSGALLAGMYAGTHGKVIEYAPSAWKGSIPKPLHHARMWLVLTPDERDVLGGEATHTAILKAREKGASNRWAKPGASYYPRSFTTHNLLDATALGLFHVKRIP